MIGTFVTVIAVGLFVPGTIAAVLFAGLVAAEKVRDVVRGRNGN